MRIGVVIVTYNSEEHIGACLDSLRGGPELELDPVVVDNASSDGSAAAARTRKGVRLVANTENLGFAGAVNQGFRALDTEFVLLLNPDARLAGGLEHLVEACRLPGAGAAGGRLEDAKGRPQAGFMVRRFPTPAALCFEILGLNRLWPGNPVNRRYRCLDLDPDTAAKVEQPAGAFVLIRRRAWEEVGGFDPAFHPLWFEDVDFLKRLDDRGYGIRYCPAARAVHEGAHSLDSMTWAKRQLSWYGSLLRYAARHFQPAGRRWVCGSIMISSAPRALVGMIQQHSVQPLVVYGALVRLAGGYMWSRETGSRS